MTTPESTREETPNRVTMMINGIEVTIPQAISALRNDLLQKDAMTSPERVAHLEHRDVHTVRDEVFLRCDLDGAPAGPTVLVAI